MDWIEWDLNWWLMLAGSQATLLSIPEDAVWKRCGWVAYASCSCDGGSENWKRKQRAISIGPEPYDDPGASDSSAHCYSALHSAVSASADGGAAHAAPFRHRFTSW